MLSKIQIFSFNLDISQKKSGSNFNITKFTADKFVKSEKLLSFKGSNFDFDRVTKNYYRGSKPDEKALKVLKDLGFKVIIDLIGDIEYNAEEAKQAVEKLGMKYINIPLKDDEPPTEEQVKDFLNIVKNADGPVFVHCRKGKDRTGLMTAIYSIEVLGLRFRSAYNEMLIKGHDFNGCFKLDKYLENYYINNCCKARGEDPKDIRDATKELRHNHFKKLNINVYNNTLSEESLTEKYAD